MYAYLAFKLYCTLFCTLIRTHSFPFMVPSFFSFTSCFTSGIEGFWGLLFVFFFLISHLLSLQGSKRRFRPMLLRSINYSWPNILNDIKIILRQCRLWIMFYYT